MQNEWLWQRRQQREHGGRRSPGSPEGSCRSGWRWAASRCSTDPDSSPDAASEPEAEKNKQKRKHEQSVTNTIRGEHSIVTVWRTTTNPRPPRHRDLQGSSPESNRAAVGQELLLCVVICGERKWKEVCCCWGRQHYASMSCLLSSY